MMKFDMNFVITIALVVSAAVTLWSVFTPNHLFIELQANIKRYEDAYGTIIPSDMPPPVDYIQ
jgi:hypothetical protein